MALNAYNPGTSTVIVDPVGPSCNISCFYCYHNNLRNFSGQKITVMDEQTLEKVVRESLLLNKNHIKFLWHGGEPMLAGKDFYKKVVDYQKLFRNSENQIVVNHMQTNATLIDDEWAQFFKENNFRLSTSIDGPEYLHDQVRKSFSGNGSYKRVIAGLEKLHSYGLSIGVVSTISSFNAEFPDEVYFELHNLNINSFEFNIASSVPGFKLFAPDPQKAIKFLKRIFDLWFAADDPKVHVRIFENCVRSLLGFPTNDCSFSYNHCREYIAIDELGDLYTCGRFLKEKEAFLGKIFTCSILNTISSDYSKALYDEVSKIKPECLECEWLNACGGGCAYQRWTNGGFGAMFPQCEIRKGLFLHIREKVKPYISRV